MSDKTVPLDCTSCGSTWEQCNHHLEEHGRGCCGACYVRDTHPPAVTTYVAVWRVEIEAGSEAEARDLHEQSLAALDDAPCSVYVTGDQGWPPARRLEESAP